MFDKINSFYFIGVGGVSMSALAKLLKDKGFTVRGSDSCVSQSTKSLKEEGISVLQGDAPEFVENCDAVVFSGAIAQDNKDLILARSLGKKIFTRAEILGIISKEYKTISVAGTHGKTTTTGMISAVCFEANIDPTIHIGGTLKEINSNLHIGKSEVLITEACEYQDAFLSLENFISVVLNIEEDHMDYFKTFDNIINSFNKFIKNTPKNGFIIYNHDNCFKNLDKTILGKRKTISYGFDKDADLQALNIKESDSGLFSFDVFFKGDKIFTVTPKAYGKHNILNALASIAVGLCLGVNVSQIKKALELFQGVGRRMDFIENKDRIIVHDYAHHPQEIEASLKAIKAMTKNKLVCIFQPHTFSRTQALYNSFLTCFSSSDEVWLLPVYSAREKPIANINSKKLSEDLNKNGPKSIYFSSFKRVKEEIMHEKNKNVSFAILGAGDIESLANDIKINNNL